MQSSYESNRNNSPAEVKIENDYPPDDHDDIYYERVLILHVDKHFIEDTATSYEDMAAKWVTNTLHELRYLRRRCGPLVLSLCAFIGFGKNRWKRRRRKGPDTKPSHPSNSIRSIAICLGRSHVLFYRHEEDYYFDVPFLIKPLQDLLENTKVVVVGLGIKEITEIILSVWISVELRKLMKCAYGKETMSWPKQDLENGGSVIDGMGLQLEIFDEQLEIFDDHLEMELLKYAGRDAFLTYKIANKCLQKFGLSWKDDSLH